MIVTAHQPGYLPGVSVVAKLAHADAVVWLDEARFTTPGFLNRNRLADGTWLTVPVCRRDHRTPIKDVTIASNGWQSDHIWTLRERFMGGDHFDPAFTEILASDQAQAGEPLVDVNLQLLGWIVDRLGLPVQQFRGSHYPAPGGSFTSKLIRMVKEVGGTAYLSGPTRHLDREAFKREGLELLTFRFAGDNPSVVDPLLSTGQLPSRPLQEVVPA